MRRRPGAATGGPELRWRTSRRSPLRPLCPVLGSSSGGWSRETSLPSGGSGAPTRDPPKAPTTVPGVFPPVGELPARVYWRRRLLVLALLFAVLGGAAWLGFALIAGRDGEAAATGESSTVPGPLLERVAPSLSAVATPDPPPRRATPQVPASASVAGGPGTEEMLRLEVRAPAPAAVGSE